MSGETSSLARTLPLICTTAVTVSLADIRSSAFGHSAWANDSPCPSLFHSFADVRSDRGKHQNQRFDGARAALR